jgi:hypothetical protein
MLVPMTACVLPLLAVLGAPPAAAASPPPVQTSADEYTRYELLTPETGRFRISYEVTATTPGAIAFFNPIRKGSVASGEAVYDRRTGRQLAFEIVGGAVARAGGLPDADKDERYIRVALPRPVPAEGEVRLLIDKTYQDPKSYFTDGPDVVFERTLSIRRNAVVLPSGYELVGCNVPAQVATEPDGRIRVSFVNAQPGGVLVRVRGRRLP